MCGICGYLGEGGRPEDLEAMAKALAHRGLDDSGLFTSGACGLAHRRLSVIDLETGQQPMADEDGNVLVYNGEIYNFRELRSDLNRRGHRFRTRSDTEVLLRAYRQWGRQCLERLRGMFAFALWDARREELFLARDRIGIKPLYYAEHRGTFYFASEAKALLELAGFPRRLNRQALDLYLSFRYTPGEQTLFAGIRKLPPGHSLSLRRGQAAQVSRYWSLCFEPDEEVPGEQWRERFWDTFDDAVRLRLVSDVPLGAYLSGGLDSSLMVAAMSGHASAPVDAFSVGFRSAAFDETPHAVEVARRFGCRHHLLEAESDVELALPQVVYHLDEPLGDLAAIPTFQMARATKPHATVVLSGEGADELLAGYPKYRAYLAGRLVEPFLPARLAALMSGIGGSIGLRRMFACLERSDRAAAYLELAAVFAPGEKQALLQSSTPDGHSPGDAAYELVRPYFDDRRDGLSQLLALDFDTWLPDDLLLKNDRMTMAHGVEARVPYLDHQLVELCGRIPARYKLSWRREKLLLRDVMAGRLPERIRRRKKTGFSVPLAQWLEGPLGETVKAVFRDEFVTAQGLFQTAYLKELVQRPLNHPYYRRQFWTIAALGLWQQRFRVESG